MIDGKFDVVFRGQIIKSMELVEVKANLAQLFKSSPEAIEKLFSGEEAVIKKSLDYATAMKYQSAIKKTGALALIKEVEEPVVKLQANPNAKRASFGASNNTDEVADVRSTAEQVTETSQSKPQIVNVESSSSTIIKDVVSNSEDNDLILADVGSQIMPDKVYEKRDVDTSEFSLAAVGERIMPKKVAEIHQQPTIDHLSLET